MSSPRDSNIYNLSRLLCLPLRRSPLRPDLRLPPLTTINLVSPNMLPQTLLDPDDSPAPTRPLDRLNMRAVDGIRALLLHPCHTRRALQRLPGQHLPHRLLGAHINNHLFRAGRPRQRRRRSIPLHHLRRGADLLLPLRSDPHSLADPRVPRHLHTPHLRPAALPDLGQVPADAELAVAELVAPAQEVPAGARRFDAEVLELRRGEGEEGVPGGYFGGVGGEFAAD